MALFFFLFFSLFAGEGCVLFSICQANAATATFDRGQVTVVRQTDGEAIFFDVEIARTAAQQAKGLMFRKHIPQQTGMLFLFDEPRTTSFWMKNTPVSLDIIYIGQDSRISLIKTNAKPFDETPIRSPGLVKGVLEIAGGESIRLGIRVGDALHRGPEQGK